MGSAPGPSEAFRIYERDLPDVPAIVDRYGKAIVVWLMPRKRDETAEQQTAFDQAVKETIQQCWPEDDIFIKQRQPQSEDKQRAQYQRISEQGVIRQLKEYGHDFEINLSDYLDTGLFLDHRHTRQRVEAQAAGKRVLNCFAYTGAFSVYALAGGAAQCLTLDMSATYLDWAKRNIALNMPLDERAKFEQVDVLQWLEQQQGTQHWDIIVCDPPTFSNSKRMKKDWQVQRDHPWLLWRLWAITAPGGICYFSNNFRGFKLAESGLPPSRSKS